MAKDAKEWRIEMDDFVQSEVLEKVLDTQRRMMLDMLTKVVEITPVGNRARWKRNIERKAKGLKGLLPKGYVGGHARKNWQVKLDRPPTNEISGEDKNGRNTRARGERAIAKLDELTIGYISNLLPYMDRLENGWSQSAPDGIVGPTIQQVRQKYRKVE
jgi:hypothetical protein